VLCGSRRVRHPTSITDRWELGMHIPHSLAPILASIAEQSAAEMGISMTIAIVDERGSLQFYLRMDGALPASMEIAVSKAYTSAILRMPTHTLGQLAVPGEKLHGIQNTHQGKIILFGGGFPLQLHGEVVGAIGISGGSVEQDMRVAQLVLDRLTEIEHWAERICLLLPRDASRRLKWSVNLENELWEALQLSVRPLSFEFVSVLKGALILALEGGL